MVIDIIPILMMTKSRLREIKKLVQRHSVCEWWNQTTFENHFSKVSREFGGWGHRHTNNRDGIIICPADLSPVNSHHDNMPVTLPLHGRAFRPPVSSN